MTNSDFLSVFCHLLLPVAYEVRQFTFLHTFSVVFNPFISNLSQFCPDLVLVCAGFDSAIGDPEVTYHESFFRPIDRRIDTEPC